MLYIYINKVQHKNLLSKIINFKLTIKFLKNNQPDIIMFKKIIKLLLNYYYPHKILFINNLKLTKKNKIKMKKMLIKALKPIFLN